MINKSRTGKMINKSRNRVKERGPEVYPVEIENEGEGEQSSLHRGFFSQKPIG